MHQPRYLPRARRLALSVPLLAIAIVALSSFSRPTAGAPRPTHDWREAIKAFAEAHLQHTAWGPAHSRRDYETTLMLARAEGVTVDEEALYAASYLHDMGGLPPYAVKGVDHGDRSIQLVDSILKDAGFPMEKAPLVKDIIDHHQYYRPADSVEVVDSLSRRRHSRFHGRDRHRAHHFAHHARGARDRSLACDSGDPAADGRHARPAAVGGREARRSEARRRDESLPRRALDRERLAQDLVSAPTHGADADASEIWSAVDEYFEGRLVHPDGALDAALESSDAAGLPSISVTASQGKLLHLIARAQNAQRILEIGTLGGYSTIWLARAVGPHGTVITLEINQTHADVARRNVERAGVADRVEVRVAPAAESLAKLIADHAEPFDLVFIDADKPSGAAYFEASLKLAHVGTVIVVDNVVRKGEIAADGPGDANVEGSRAVTETIGRTPGVEATAVQTVGTKGYDGFIFAVVTQEMRGR